MATLRSSCFAWEQAPSSASPAPEAGGPRKLPADVRVQIHGAFMVEVLNPDPVYTKCKECNTKIDPETKECKKTSTGCPATPGEMTALSGIRLGDFSGGNVEILADEDALCKIAGVSGVEALKALVEKTGPQSLTFRTRCDVRVGANKIRSRLGRQGNAQESGPSQAGGVSPALKTPPRLGEQQRIWMNSPAAASQSSPVGSQGLTVLNEHCDWQLMLASPVLAGPWDSKERPAVQKVFSHGSDASPGQVLPVVSPSAAFVETAMGPQHETTKAKPDFVFTLGFAADEATVERSDDHAVLVRHAAVYPYRGENSSKATEDVFAVEANCTLSETCWFNMADSKPRFIVGSLRRCGGLTTLIAERIFTVQHPEIALQNFQAECAAVNELLSNTIEHLPSKRSAEALIIDTPTKKAATGLYAAERSQ